jgi:hypothetical protein
MYKQRTTFHRSQPTAALSMALLLLLTAALATPARALPPTPATVNGSVTWQPPAKIISNGFDTGFPWAAVDSNNVTHVIYAAYPESANALVMYTNNASGSFNIAGQLIDTAGPSATSFPFAAIAVGPNNVIHMVYVLFGKDNQVYYRRSDNGGQTWSSRIQISNAQKAASPHLTVDSNNNAHIVWIDNRCGQYNVYYLSIINGVKSATLTPVPDCTTYENRPQIAIAGGKPQVVFQYGTEIYYRRLDSDNQWRGANISQSPGANSANAAIASDGSNKLFVAWDEGINGHDIEFRASFDGGGSWSNVLSFSNTPELATAPNVIWSAATGRAYIAWHDNTGSLDNKGEIWIREFDPNTTDTTAATQITHSAGRSFWPTVGVGPSRADIVWMDEVAGPSGVFQVYDLAGQVLGASGCSGTLVLANGADQTRGGQVPAAITATCSDGGTPAAMQISIDAPPTDTSNPAQIPFNANPTITMTDGGCEHTVYVRLFKDNAPGQTFSDSIKVDDTVNASVMVANPNMLGLPPIYTPGSSTNARAIGPADAYEGGASDGHPKYTRVRKFFLGITDVGDCTGLGDFFVPGSDTTQPKEIPLAGFAGSPALPGFGDPGEKPISVVISDTIGNQQAYGPMSLIYDPDHPVLNGGSVSGDSKTGTILRTLNFSGVSVDDTLYGQYESLPAGQQFWGVWLANVNLTATPNITPDSPGLNWFPVPVGAPSAQFSLQWSLFSGLDYGPTQGHEGSYRVLVRFLDGAGNPTQGVLSTTLTLDSGYTTPQTFLPTIHN